jgi:hypothetical protein
MDTYICPICHDDIINTDIVYIHKGDGYRHPMHANCIMGWLRAASPAMANKCPLCRYSLGSTELVQSEIGQQNRPRDGSYGISFVTDLKTLGILTVGVITTKVLLENVVIPAARFVGPLGTVGFCILLARAHPGQRRGGTRKKSKKRGGNKYIMGKIDFSSANPFHEFLNEIDKINKDYAGKEKNCSIFFENIDLPTSKQLLKVFNINDQIHVSKI